MARTRNASAAVGDETADGSTSPGFCGASSSVFTRSHPATASTAVADARIVSRARFIFFILSYRPRLGLVLQVESERDVSRRRAGIEVLRHFGRRHTVVLFWVNTREARPRVDVPETEHDRRAIRRSQQVIDARRQDQRARKLAELPELRRREVAETRG